jgi:hypothetical protein
MNAASEMASGYDVPDLKKILSARLRLSSHAKIGQVLTLWKEKAKLDGKAKANIDAMTPSHVVDVLLAKVLDEELAQFGGFAETDEAKERQLKALRDAHKAQSK